MYFKKTYIHLIFFIIMMCPSLGNDNELFASNIQIQVEVMLKTAEVFINHGEYDLAIKQYDQAINLIPENLSLYYNRAIIWGKSNNYINAIKDLTFVIQRENSNRYNNNTIQSFPHAIRFRGDSYMALGYMKKAAEDYQTFLKSSPTDGKVWSYLVEAFSLMGEQKLAIQAAKKGILSKSHWSDRLKQLQKQILMGETITPHKPFSN